MAEDSTVNSSSTDSLTANSTTNSSITSSTKNPTTNALASKLYVAPLKLEPNSTTPWRYYVLFDHSHTLEAHKKAMGDISVRKDAPQPEGLWSGTMADEY
ncbi:hypothetical protein KCU83_g8805, partial [Aureobasidium melanogenum]